MISRARRIPAFLQLAASVYRSSEVPISGIMRREQLEVAWKRSVRYRVSAYDALYEKRLNHYYNDLKWLYCELFRDHPEVAGTFSSLTKKMKEIYCERSLSMKEADQNCAADPDWFRSPG